MFAFMDRNQLIETTIFIIKLAVTKKLTEKTEFEPNQTEFEINPAGF